MLRNSEVFRNVKAVGAFYALAFILCIFVQSNATPVPDITEDYSIESRNSSDNQSASLLDNDLYVVKAVVYEIGILTDADNATSDSTERQEEVNVSFYDRPNEDELSKHDETPVPEALLFSLYNITL